MTLVLFDFFLLLLTFGNLSGKALQLVIKFVQNAGETKHLVLNVLNCSYFIFAVFTASQ